MAGADKPAEDDFPRLADPAALHLRAAGALDRGLVVLMLAGVKHMDGNVNLADGLGAMALVVVIGLLE